MDRPASRDPLISDRDKVLGTHRLLFVLILLLVLRGLSEPPVVLGR
jgi:hypothetical protein